MTIKEIIDRVESICGSSELADKMLETLEQTDYDEATLNRIFTKYICMCVDEIRDGQQVSVTNLAKNIFLIHDHLDDDTYIVIIHEEGQLEFFKKVNEYKTLAEYISEYCAEKEYAE